MPKGTWDSVGAPGRQPDRFQVLTRSKDDMDTLNSVRDFDSRARTWDDDPMKTARALAVAEAISARIPNLTGLCGFEYGCGTGLLSFALQPRLQHIARADSSPAPSTRCLRHAACRARTISTC